MTCEELQTILEAWRDEVTQEQINAEDTDYAYNEGKLVAFKMIVELLQKKGDILGTKKNNERADK